MKKHSPRSTSLFHYYLRDHLGSVRVVFNENDSVEQVNHYYPSGVLMDVSTGADTQPMKYTGKELVREWGMESYDYGARWMLPVTGPMFTQPDPLSEKYYDISPYAYCKGNFMNAVDPDGREVHPTDSTAYSVLLNTIAPEDRQYVVLNQKGNVDVSIMQSHPSESGNYATLLNLVESDMTFNISILANYTYMDNAGNINENGELTYCGFDEYFLDIDFSSPSGLTTGETGKYGITLLPGQGHSGSNSIDKDAYIYVHPSLSTIGRAEALSHELYGHGYLYNMYRDRNISRHDFVGGKDRNIRIRQCIKRTRMETVSYFK